MSPQFEPGSDLKFAPLAELVDALVLGTSLRVRVRVSQGVQNIKHMKYTPFDFAFRIFGCTIFSVYHTLGFGFVRILGIGFDWKNTKIRPMTFSERTGYKKYLRIRNWVFTYLPYR
jgi:hypothetical protein